MSSVAVTVPFLSPESDASTSRVDPLKLPGDAHYTQYFISPSGVAYGLVQVTPQLARAWMRHNTENRSLRTAAAEKFGRDMANGDWHENGDAIRFTRDWTLLDGQHRLVAIADSGTTQLLLVVSGLHRAAQDTIDDGTKRTMGDRLTFHGEPSPAVLSGVLRWVILWENGKRSQTGQYAPTVTETLTFLDQHRSVRVAVQAAEKYRKTKLLTPPTIGLCWWLFSRIDTAGCEDFFARLASGEHGSVNDPVWVLRERLREINAATGRVSGTYKLAITIKAWNAYRERREVSQLRFGKNEEIPEPR